jgi:hypothetical protein
MSVAPPTCLYPVGATTAFLVGCLERIGKCTVGSPFAYDDVDELVKKA